MKTTRKSNYRYKVSIFNSASGLSVLIATSLIGLLMILQYTLARELIFKSSFENSTSRNCQNKQKLSLEVNETVLLLGEPGTSQDTCYQIELQADQELFVKSNTQAKLELPSKETLSFQGLASGNALSEEGQYLLFIPKKRTKLEYRVEVGVKNNSYSSQNASSDLAESNQTEPVKQHQEKNLDTTLTYNVKSPPPFKNSQNLQAIVNNIIDIAQDRGLKTNKLSVSLVDISPNQSVCCSYAAFADNQPRYPASIVKLFWLVVLFGQYEAQQLKLGTISEETLLNLIQDSDNEAGSVILDAVTNTESGSALPPDVIKDWKAKRDSVNLFFEQAGYTDINIGQKTYPIPYLGMNLPVGRDKQIRDEGLKLREQEANPIRNYLTTYSVARLLYEIYSNQAVSPSYSNKMKDLLKRNLDSGAWKNKPFNSIEGFLGEGLPENASSLSKMGWTFNNRNDAAIISSPDGKRRYILVVFGDDKSFYEDTKFLPEVSRLVYSQMSN